jgi:ABC-type phosphate transport system substrate-binding protein
MKRTTWPTWIAAAFLSCLAWCIRAPLAVAQANDVAVIVNSRNSITNIGLVDLRKIFSGEKHAWQNRTPIKLMVRPPGSHERLVLLKLLGMSESEYKQYWTAQVVRGDADAEPLMLPSFGMVKEAAEVYPGAIAFLDARDIRTNMILKVIKVDGHLPGEPGYPLH